MLICQVWKYFFSKKICHGVKLKGLARVHVARLEADVSGLNRGNLNICERLLARDNQCRGGLAACSTLVASQKAAVGQPGWTCNWGSYSSFSSYSFSFLILILLQVCLALKREPSLRLGRVKLQQRMFARRKVVFLVFVLLNS